MATTKQPQPTDRKYLLDNGNYNQDAYLTDYYNWLNSVNAIPDPRRASMFKSKETTPEQSGGNPGYPDTTGPGNANDPDQIARGNAPVTPEPPQQPKPKAASDGASDNKDAPSKPKDNGNRPWWETAADASDTATGNTMGGKDASPMPDDWMGEIKNFRESDQRKLKDMYSAGTSDKDFRDQVHTSRQDRYDTYAHGYDWADKDTPDDNPHSAANAAFFEDPSWLDEVDTMSQGEQSRYMRALQAADPESAQTVLDESRKRRGNK